MVWLLVALLLAFWLAGLVWDLLGGLIHVLLVLAVVVGVARVASHLRGSGRQEQAER